MQNPVVLQSASDFGDTITRIYNFFFDHPLAFLIAPVAWFAMLGFYSWQIGRVTGIVAIVCAIFAFLITIGIVLIFVQS